MAATVPGPLKDALGRQGFDIERQPTGVSEMPPTHEAAVRPRRQSISANDYSPNADLYEELGEWPLQP
jgi:hypothetical protein